jgi:hypothetical protein
VDIPASLAGDGLALEVATRNRKKDGEWSKPKGRRFALNEIAHLPEPADRQALSILAGGREQVSGYYSGLGYYDSAPARLHLTHALSEALLPTLCATGRCLLRQSDPDGSMRPLRWDDTGPWEFWLTATPDDAGKTYVVTGELRRGEERMAMETPLLLLSGGLVFWEDRVAPLVDHNAFQWIVLLRQEREVRFPAKQKQEFLAQLLRLPELPRLDLPEDLRYEEITLAPRPYLKIKRRDDRGWRSERDQNRLIGELSFEYDGHVVPERSPARSVFEPDKRRLLLRDPAAERSFVARLEEVGFHRRTDYRQGETLELLARNLPKAARALLQEGWRVEAQGKLYREAGDFRIEVTSGIDWFELHGGATFGDQEVPLPTLLAALRRGEDLVPLGDGSFGLLPEEWLKKYVTLAGVGTPEGDHLRFRRTQVGLLDVLLAEQPEARFDKRFERARAAAPVPGRCARGPAGRVPGSTPRLSARRPWLAPLPPGVRFRRLPGRRHGPGQDRPGARPAGGAPRAAGRPQKTPPTPAVAGRGAAVARLQLEAGGRSFHAEAPRPGQYRHRPG